ncbi:hypothetical protein NPIL_87111 [Nephila pilipes]|uniref:HTH CENPB-type domain-containing protein n=1 Tax=Nephila pilipes TaxID=299642 RepID=A0A8X6TUP4_NEPPI|nr:hypothetical protein NPIL_87111 [Nephila pilipes]
MKNKKNPVGVISSISAKYATRPLMQFPPETEKMEKTLSNWIHDRCERRNPLDVSIIKQKSNKIYKPHKELGESSVNPDFVASKDWFEKLKKKFFCNS